MAWEKRTANARMILPALVMALPTEILDGIQVGDYNKMDYGNSNVAGKMRRSDGRTDDKEYDGIWQM